MEPLGGELEALVEAGSYWSSLTRGCGARRGWARAHCRS